jgi:hypothetical protein
MVTIGRAFVVSEHSGAIDDSSSFMIACTIERARILELWRAEQAISTGDNVTLWNFYIVRRVQTSRGRTDTEQCSAEISGLFR